LSYTSAKRQDSNTPRFFYSRTLYRNNFKNRFCSSAKASAVRSIANGSIIYTSHHRIWGLLRWIFRRRRSLKKEGGDLRCFLSLLRFREGCGEQLGIDFLMLLLHFTTLLEFFTRTAGTRVVSPNFMHENLFKNMSQDSVGTGIASTKNR
jgi:hypothetical protein